MFNFAHQAGTLDHNSAVCELVRSLFTDILRSAQKDEYHMQSFQAECRDLADNLLGKSEFVFSVEDVSCFEQADTAALMRTKWICSVAHVTADLQHYWVI